MRVTYRTACVLRAIGEQGGRGSNLSNRAVGDAAGIKDQAQISKLLARLARLGLIENASDGARGRPYAWTLTKRGRELTQEIASRAP